MEDQISPKYLMKLIENISRAIYEEYKSYKTVKRYIEKWHDWDINWENFAFKYKADGFIDLDETLHTMNGDLLLKIAIDMGVETPDYIPSISTFRNEIKADYKTASTTFEKAFKQIETHPDIAIGLANSALESIIKEIFKDERIILKPKAGDTLYDLTSALLKEFQLFPKLDLPIEIKTIGSSLLSINQSIEKLRSEKTFVHGKTIEDYVIKDSLYAYFIVNSITTVGLFLISFYKKNFPSTIVETNPGDDLPF